MRTRHVLTALLAASLALPGLTSCSRNQAAGDIVPANGITVVVTNQNFYDMDLHVVSQGLATRLGTVTGNHEQTFVLDPSVVSQDFRIVATPIGGSGRASTGPLVVAPGQTVSFRIAPQLQNSTAFIR